MEDIPLHRLGADSESDFPLLFYRTELTPQGSIGPGAHRHTFNELFLILAGNGSHIIDFKEYPIETGTLYTVGRGQVHYWELEALPAGFVILFTDELFHLFGNERFMSRLDLFHSFGNAALYLSREEVDWFKQTMETLESEFQKRAFGRQEIIVSLVQMMLIRAQRHYLSTYRPSETSIADQRITRQFLDLLERSVSENPSVGQLADAIGVTVAHLTTMIRRVMGFSAGALIRQRRILEAKRLLVHTDMTVAEIATALNFTDPSYFGRFFKRETNLTPSGFRQHFKRKYQNS